MTAKKLLIVVALLIVLFYSLSIESAMASTQKTMTLQPLGGYIMGWTLQGNEKITGTVSTTHTIQFSITDSDGFIIKDYGKISEPQNFEITPTKSGNYTLKFQSLSMYETSVQVSYEVVTPAITPFQPFNVPSGINYPDINFFNPFIIACLVSIPLIVVALMFNRFIQKRKANKKQALAFSLTPNTFKYCSVCGAALSTNEKFCHNCGKPVE